MVSKIQKAIMAICEDRSDENLPRLGDAGTTSSERIEALAANKKKKPVAIETVPVAAQTTKAVAKEKVAKPPAATGKRHSQWHIPEKLDTESLASQGKVQALAPQAREIYGVVLNHGPLTREELCQKLAATIKTRQPVERIVAFYRSALIKAGLVKISNIGA